MSSASPFGSNRAPTSVAQALRTLAVRPVEAAGFWTAVLVPLVYPALLYGGLDGRELPLLLAALGLNAVALFLGRDHNRDAA